MKRFPRRLSPTLRMVEQGLHDMSRSDVNSAKTAVMAKGAMNLAMKQMNQGGMGMMGFGALNNLKNMQQEWTNVQAGMAKAEKRFKKQEIKQIKKIEKKAEKKAMKKLAKSAKNRAIKNVSKNKIVNKSRK